VYQGEQNREYDLISPFERNFKFIRFRREESERGFEDSKYLPLKIATVGIIFFLAQKLKLKLCF
jgi:hypothetical protein